MGKIEANELARFFVFWVGILPLLGWAMVFPATKVCSFPHPKFVCCFSVGELFNSNSSFNSLCSFVFDRCLFRNCRRKRNFFESCWNPPSKHDYYLGVYSVVRHPQYLGGLLAHVGITFLFSAWFSLLSTPMMGLLVFLISKKEEKELSKEFGKEFQEYAEEVSMFLPRFWHHRKKSIHLS